MNDWLFAILSGEMFAITILFFALMPVFLIVAAINSIRDKNRD